jgi:hypothetical protein
MKSTKAFIVKFIIATNVRTSGGSVVKYYCKYILSLLSIFILHIFSSKVADVFCETGMSSSNTNNMFGSPCGAAITGEKSGFKSTAYRPIFALRNPRPVRADDFVIPSR